MRLRFYVDDGALAAEVSCTAAPDRGDRVALDGIMHEVSGRRWDVWSIEADPIVNVYLVSNLSVRGPKPTLKKAKGKPR